MTDCLVLLLCHHLLYHPRMVDVLVLVMWLKHLVNIVIVTVMSCEYDVIMMSFEYDIIMMSCEYDIIRCWS